MRLRKISSEEEGNRYLEEEFIEAHNGQFGKDPADSQNGHKLLNPKEDLEKILATREERTISKNFTIQYNNRIYQLKINTPNRMRYKKVVTIERAGNPLVIEYQGKGVPYTLWEEHKYLGPEIVDDKQLESKWARKSA